MECVEGLPWTDRSDVLLEAPHGDELLGDLYLGRRDDDDDDDEKLPGGSYPRLHDCESDVDASTLLKMEQSVSNC